ncbi:uncharacterized protein YALI1_F23201g [Yarrowia lipolytica]|uniref:Uncharacterized protein n=1 Tax=Yarrowia lipolytica TaxID=4952 RepID=A0A1D8NNU5_YARLL|nr:hypothetical protein YALI1_F23201g [Yarrowia lipolytica]
MKSSSRSGVGSSNSAAALTLGPVQVPVKVATGTCIRIVQSQQKRNCQIILSHTKTADSYKSRVGSPLNATHFSGLGPLNSILHDWSLLRLGRVYAEEQIMHVSGCPLQACVHSLLITQIFWSFRLGDRPWAESAG